MNYEIIGSSVDFFFSSRRCKMLTMRLARIVIKSMKVAWGPFMKEFTDFGVECWPSCPRSQSLDAAAIDLLKLLQHL